MCEQRTHGRGRPGEGQTQEHQERDELVACLHVGHGEVTVVAAVAHHGRGQHICQLQEVEGHQGGEHDGELDGSTHARKDKDTAKADLMFAGNGVIHLIHHTNQTLSLSLTRTPTHTRRDNRDAAVIFARGDK